MIVIAAKEEQQKQIIQHGMQGTVWSQPLPSVKTVFLHLLHCKHHICYS